MNRFLKTFAALLLVLPFPPAAEAEGEEPLRPEEAYRYVVSDTGDALEIDWAIEDGYYLYRNELGFETTTSGVVIGEPRLPAGETHEDQYFGKQQVFRERFYVSVPYQVSGERPESIDLVIKSRGC
jgi:thiol:disulfide interchange protein DsbD